MVQDKTNLSEIIGIVPAKNIKSISAEDAKKMKDKR